MASVFRRPKSVYYWVAYRDPATGKRTRKSTGIRADRADGKRLAKRIEADFTHKEMSSPRAREAERWESWADAYLVARYRNTHTLATAKMALRDMLAFFKAHDIRTPAMLTYHHAAKFVEWRTKSGDLEPVSTNTARLRFVYLSVLAAEAVRRGYAQFNPCRDVKNVRVKPREKLEITPEYQAIIESELERKPQWMRDQWLVLMRQGCRVSETEVPMERIDTDRMTITLKVKGGALHTAQLHPDLLPLIERARTDGRKHLIERESARNWSAIWSDFFKRRGLPFSIHCTRVTVVTRLIRAGHSPALISSFIGHSEEINRIYRRLRPVDAASLLGTLASTPSPSSGSTTPQNQGQNPAPPERGKE